LAGARKKLFVSLLTSKLIPNSIPAYSCASPVVENLLDTAQAKHPSDASNIKLRADQEQ